MQPGTTLIIGGGIGGLALAAALERIGSPYVVLEQADELGEVGSGLGVMPGAVRALETLGVGADLFARAPEFRLFRVATARGKDLGEVSFTRVFERAGRPGYVMHRGALHAALKARVDPEAIRTGSRVEAVEQHGAAVRARLADGSAVEGDVLVGADGLNSVVRRAVLGDGAPRYAGETIFRGIAEARLDRPDLCRELFGAGRRAAYYDMGAGRVYWWATAPLPAGTIIPPPERRAHLEGAFTGWSFGLPDLLAQTPADAILQNDIFDRRPASAWHRGAMVLLGDAAHPTTPNLGQGACMAIEDAVVLARSIRRAGTLDDAFRAFHASRSRRTARTVRLSRLWGAAGLWRSPWATRLRDAAMRLTPAAMLERSACQQYCYDPGTLD